MSVSGGCGALHAAAASGDASRVRQLLSAPAPRGAFPLRLTGWGSGRTSAPTRPDINELDAAGCTPLQRAAADGHEEIVRLLLAHGADVNRKDASHGNTALHEAAWKGYSRTAALLATAGAQLGLPNKGGFAPLHLCCQNGHNQSCRELLLAGCDPDLQNNYGDTALHTSARYGHAGVTRILISAQCRVSEQNKNGDTALHIAAAMGRRKLTRILLEAGCDASLKNKQNETARDIAVRKDLNEIINIINSAKPKRKDKSTSKTKVKDKKKKSSPKVKFDPKSVPWSPYGCHYFPDPSSFPKPKLDTLPNEPLKKGEQYYLDLAGNICKGPIGVGYTCYCAPFFKHMEERLDRDKQELKAHIDKAHEKFGHKVTDLELKTQGQISELTRCVAAERALCDRRHRHLERWILRGQVTRRSERTRRQEYVPLDNAVMPRSKSLELLDDFKSGLPQKDFEECINSKSMELLDCADGQADKDNNQTNKIKMSKSTSHISDKLKTHQKNMDNNDSNRKLLPLFNFKSQALRESANVNWLFRDGIKPNVHVITVDHHADDDFEPRKTVSEIVAQLQMQRQTSENSSKTVGTSGQTTHKIDNKNDGDNSESSDDEDNPIRNTTRPGLMRNSNLEIPNYENVNPAYREEAIACEPYRVLQFSNNPYYEMDINFNSNMYTARTRNGVYSPTTLPETNALSNFTETDGDRFQNVDKSEVTNNPVKHDLVYYQQNVNTKTNNIQLDRKEPWQDIRYINPLEINTEIHESSRQPAPYVQSLEIHPKQNDVCLNFVHTNLNANVLNDIQHSKIDRRQVDLHKLERDVHNRIANLHMGDRDKKKDLNILEHNDSGYSTKVYGSSQGNSPSLSGQLDVDSALVNKVLVKQLDIGTSSLV